MKAPFIAADWGTTSLRLALIDPSGRVRDERRLAEGILNIAADGYAPVLIALQAHSSWAISGFCIASGMVGSRQGWVEAPYANCPAGIADVAPCVVRVPTARAPTGLAVAIVPGLVCEDAQGVPDVMRGEETQVFGACDLLGIDDGLFVLPGTHSKWATVRGRRIERFATAMTGEVYALLRRQSILARTMPEGDDPPLVESAFLAGVHHARFTDSLLRGAFSARTLALFDRMGADAMPSYLSGLVIGEEVRGFADELRAASAAVLVGAPALTERYALALGEVGVACRRVGDEATWRGLWAIARQMEESGA